MAADWDKARADAIKLLGKDAEVPDLTPAVTKADDAFTKANDAFPAARKELESKLLDLQDANSALTNAVKQLKATVEKSDFGLDRKKDAKKIQQAEKMLTASLDDALKTRTTVDKTLDELDKHLIQLSKYKSPPNSLS